MAASVSVFVSSLASDWSQNQILWFWFYYFSPFFLLLPLFSVHLWSRFKNPIQKFWVIFEYTVRSLLCNRNVPESGHWTACHPYLSLLSFFFAIFFTLALFTVAWHWEVHSAATESWHFCSQWCKISSETKASPDIMSQHWFLTNYRPTKNDIYCLCCHCLL